MFTTAYKFITDVVDIQLFCFFLVYSEEHEMVQPIFTHRTPQLINMHKLRKNYWSRACGTCGTGSDAPALAKAHLQFDISIFWRQRVKKPVKLCWNAMIIYDSHYHSMNIFVALLILGDTWIRP